MVKGRLKSVVEVAVDFVQHRADLVVTVTEGFAATLRARGIKNVATVSNGLHVDMIPVMGSPEPERDVFEALYLGNHGASQHLEVTIRASALVGDAMHLHLVGHGTQRPALEKLARQLKAPVTFHAPMHGEAVMERYASADTCIVSLRDDWKSFETTVPSKTYEVLSLGRHVTAIVKGEAARIIEDAEAGDIVPSTRRPSPLFGANFPRTDPGLSATRPAGNGSRNTRNTHSLLANTWISSQGWSPRPQPARRSQQKAASPDFLGTVAWPLVVLIGSRHS